MCLKGQHTRWHGNVPSEEGAFMRTSIERGLIQILFNILPLGRVLMMGKFVSTGY
jgi:hypothetical protein